MASGSEELPCGTVVVTVRDWDYSHRPETEAVGAVVAAAEVLIAEDSDPARAAQLAALDILLEAPGCYMHIGVIVDLLCISHRGTLRILRALRDAGYARERTGGLWACPASSVARACIPKLEVLLGELAAQKLRSTQEPAPGEQPQHRLGTALQHLGLGKRRRATKSAI
jgi:hypothetical protein